MLDKKLIYCLFSTSHHLEKERDPNQGEQHQFQNLKYNSFVLSQYLVSCLTFFVSFLLCSNYQWQHPTKWVEFSLINFLHWAGFGNIYDWAYSWLFWQFFLARVLGHLILLLLQPCLRISSNLSLQIIERVATLLDSHVVYLSSIYWYNVTTFSFFYYLWAWTFWGEPCILHTTKHCRGN